MMPDKGASMADEPKGGEDKALWEHLDQRRPQDKPMPEFEKEVREEESEPAIEAATRPDESGERDTRLRGLEP